MLHRLAVTAVLLCAAGQGSGSPAGGASFTLTFAGMPPLSTGYFFFDVVSLSRRSRAACS